MGPNDLFHLKKIIRVSPPSDLPQREAGRRFFLQSNQALFYSRSQQAIVSMHQLRQSPAPLQRDFRLAALLALHRPPAVAACSSKAPLSGIQEAFIASRPEAA